MSVYAYWIYAGFFYLILLTYQDIFKKMRVDDRLNFFMGGVTMSLLSHIKITLIYLLGILGIVVLTQIILRMSKVIGEGDINTLSWLFFGLGVISPNLLAFFVVAWLALSLVQGIIAKIIKIKGEYPYYPVLLATFFFTFAVYIRLIV